MNDGAYFKSMRDSKPMSASEMGKRGARARMTKMTPEQRSAVARLAGIARWAKMVDNRTRCLAPEIEQLTTTAEMKAWSSLRTIRGDVQTYIEQPWSRRIPKAYEELLDASMKAGNVDASLRILVAMTAMSPLTPARLKQVVDDALLKLPDDIDLSHLDDETLQRITGKKP
jgi:hypothetical protein